MTKREQFVLMAAALAVIVGSVVLLVTRAVATRDRGEPASLPDPKKSVPAAVAIQEPVPQEVMASVAETIAASTEAPALAPVAVEASGPATVFVRGAVARPGVYTLESNARVRDALSKAGGALKEADVSDLNAAAPLIDGSILTVPVRAMSGMQGERLVLRPGQPAAALNPPEYTISGWKPKETAKAPAWAEPGAPMAGVAATTKEAAGPLDLNSATIEQLEGLPGIGPKLAGEIARYREGHRFGSVEDLMNVSGIGPKRLDAIRSLVAVK